jgi:hypothetical protein
MAVSGMYLDVCHDNLTISAYVSTTDIPVTILDIIHRPAFYLKHTIGNVRTSQEAHYISATSPTG